jgi:alanine dehydrogenase
VERLNEMQRRLGRRFFTSVFQKDVLLKNLKSADVAIGASEFSGRIRRYLVPDELVRQMKKGSVIIDLNVDNEPNFETSVVSDFGKPAFTKHGIIHYCVPNIASRASRTASISLSNALLPLIQKMSQTTEIHHLIRECVGFKNGTYIYKGILTNEHIGNKFGIDFKDINLLTAVY